MLDFMKKNKEVNIYSPISGEVIDISEVPDPVFSQKILGDGIAINPTDGIVVAPCSGKIVQVFPTKHLVAIETREGIEILIHLGLDTVELNGKGFTVFVSQGDKVKQGDKLIEMDLSFLKDNTKSLVSPIVIANTDSVGIIEKYTGKAIYNKDLIMKVTNK